MMKLRVPSVACVIGEGGSGGAVAIAVADRVLMQENSIYSVISPGGLRGDPLAGRERGEEGGRRVQAGRPALPRARRHRRDRPRARRRRACGPRRGGVAARRRARGGARGGRGPGSGDAPARSAPALPRHGRLRLVVSASASLPTGSTDLSAGRKSYVFYAKTPEKDGVIHRRGKRSGADANVGPGIPTPPDRHHPRTRSFEARNRSGMLCVVARLREYERKRDSGKTPEPFGGDERLGPAPIFVVQRHAARRLHYDFRLERDGALASWAVPEGRPARDRRAAPRRPRRGPPARLRDLRGRDPGRPVRRGHGRDLGQGPLRPRRGEARRRPHGPPATASACRGSGRSSRPSSAATRRLAPDPQGAPRQDRGQRRLRADARDARRGASDRNRAGSSR